MGSKKVHVFIVKSNSGETGLATRLIRGALKDVEAKLRAEVSIEPATPEQTHVMHDVDIEEAGE